jgi:hypothetical protein
MTTRSAVKLLAFFAVMTAVASAEARLPAANHEIPGVFEHTFTSNKPYADPFNDVDVDVVFSSGDEKWRVPTFWRGGNRWTVRFAPPVAGEYTYHLESSDCSNPDLNGHQTRVKLTKYARTNPLLQHGMLRVSEGQTPL